MLNVILYLVVANQNPIHIFSNFCNDAISHLKHNIFIVCPHVKFVYELLALLSAPPAQKTHPGPAMIFNLHYPLLGPA